MSIKEMIYDHSPLLFQNLAVSAYGYKLYGERYDKYYWMHRQFLCDFDKMSREQQHEYQISELCRLLRYAVDKSSFYQRLYSGIDVESIKTIEDLKKLPVVTKEMLRENIDSVITIPAKNAIEGHTGGTTGKSLIVLCTTEDIQKRMAVLDHFKERFGFHHLKMKRATFNGKHIVPPNNRAKVFWRDNIFMKQRIYSSFHISEEYIQYYVDNLNQYKPESIDGFVSSIYEIASYILRKNIKMSFVPLAIFGTSETITSMHRNIIEKAFGCKVVDQYASSEGAPFITECTSGKLHYETSTGVFEHLDDSSDEVLVTSFTTYGTPLIRYRIMDNVGFSESDEFCSCGQHTPLMRYIEGRAVEFLYAENGTKIFLGNISNVFKELPNAILKAQLIQDTSKSITVKIVVDKNRYDASQDSIITDAVMHKFGSGMDVVIQRVDDIPRETSGKYRLIINNVKPEN